MNLCYILMTVSYLLHTVGSKAIETTTLATFDLANQKNSTEKTTTETTTIKIENKKNSVQISKFSEKKKEDLTNSKLAQLEKKYVPPQPVDSFRKINMLSGKFNTENIQSKTKLELLYNSHLKNENQSPKTLLKEEPLPKPPKKFKKYGESTYNEDVQYKPESMRPYNKDKSERMVNNDVPHNEDAYSEKVYDKKETTKKLNHQAKASNKDKKDENLSPYDDDEIYTDDSVSESKVEKKEKESEKKKNKNIEEFIYDQDDFNERKSNHKSKNGNGRRFDRPEDDDRSDYNDDDVHEKKPYYKSKKNNDHRNTDENDDESVYNDDDFNERKSYHKSKNGNGRRFDRPEDDDRSDYNDDDFDERKSNHKSKNGSGPRNRDENEDHSKFNMNSFKAKEDKSDYDKSTLFYRNNRNFDLKKEKSDNKNFKKKTFSSPYDDDLYEDDLNESKKDIHDTLTPYNNNNHKDQEYDSKKRKSFNLPVPSFDSNPYADKKKTESTIPLKKEEVNHEDQPKNEFSKKGKAKKVEQNVESQKEEYLSVLDHLQKDEDNSEIIDYLYSHYNDYKKETSPADHIDFKTFVHNLYEMYASDNYEESDNDSSNKESYANSFTSVAGKKKYGTATYNANTFNYI